MNAWSIVALAMTAWVCAFGTGLLVAGLRHGFRWWAPPRLVRSATPHVVRARAAALAESSAK